MVTNRATLGRMASKKRSSRKSRSSRRSRGRHGNSARHAPRVSKTFTGGLPGSLDELFGGYMLRAVPSGRRWKGVATFPGEDLAEFESFASTPTAAIAKLRTQIRQS
jgi:hypothetical protein